MIPTHPCKIYSYNYQSTTKTVTKREMNRYKVQLLTAFGRKKSTTSYGKINDISKLETIKGCMSHTMFVDFSLKNDINGQYT